MSRGFLRLAIVPALLALSAGCGPTRELLQSALGPPTAAEPIEPYVPTPERPAFTGRKPQNILALSGGGSYGAFTAGVLNGWSQTKARPEFDVVTGISTGALIAPMAFLGEEHDAMMRHFYTEVTRSDIFRYRTWATIPFHVSAATTDPLRKIVEDGLSEAKMARLAEEHKKGRRLYIGTTHLEARRTVVWDIGAIACRPGPRSRELIADIIVASCSIPGVMPPVTIDVDGSGHVERHVDGGVTASLFVPVDVMEAARDANLYVVIAGKYFADPAKVRAWMPRVLGASGESFLFASSRRDVSNLYHLSKLAGVKFHVLALRGDFTFGSDSAIDFEPEAMSQLFVEGAKVGLAGPVWETVPPERTPGEAEIRTGRRLPSETHTTR
jgi:predicted acylesterase/phospholipase RssA